MKLSEQLKRDHDCGDFGKALTGYADRDALLEAVIVAYGMRVAAMERDECIKTCEAATDTGNSIGIERDVAMWNKATAYCIRRIKERPNMGVSDCLPKDKQGNAC